jgi:hypothetical protein
MRQVTVDIAPARLLWYRWYWKATLGANRIGDFAVTRKGAERKARRAAAQLLAGGWSFVVEETT